MAKTISASVGRMGGVNRPDHVRTEIPDEPTETKSQMDLELPGGSVSVAMRVHLMPTTLKKARTVAVFRMPFTLIKIAS
jgi:hypothetical protein